MRACSFGLATTFALAAFAFAGCESEDHTDHHGGDAAAGHNTPFPACTEITQSCHKVDVGEGPIHDCHDAAHAAKAESDCTSIKERCLQICADAGAAADPDAGT